MYFSYWLAYKMSLGMRSSLGTTLQRMLCLNVALGLAGMLLALFVLHGFCKEVSGKLHGLVGDMHIRPHALSSQSYVMLDTGLYAEWQQSKNTHKDIAFIQPYAWQPALLKTKQRVLGIQLKGIATPYGRGFGGLVDGRMLAFKPKGQSRECLLSTRIADEMQLKVGDTAIIHMLMEPPRYRKLKVVGTYKTAIEELDDRLVITDLKVLRRLRKWPAHLAEGLEVFLHTRDNLKIRLAMFSLPKDSEAVDVADIYPEIFNWLGILDRNTHVFIALVGAVTCFNLLALCMLLIAERKEMLATLRALGAAKGQLMRLFFFHGMVWIGLGMLIGNALALGIAMLQVRLGWFSLNEESYVVDQVPMYINGSLFLATNIGLGFFLALGLWFSLYKLGRQKEVDVAAVQGR